jgi:RNA polymerase sigma factor (sigma-70 family)
MTDTLLQELYPTVNRAVDLVLARRRRRREFAQDFRGFVMLKMLERNEAKLRSFRGESAPLTYLRVVVSRLYCDYLSSRNGKWRPSSKARELGAEVVALEKLVYRDGLTLREAIAMMEPHVGRGRELSLRESFSEIPVRYPRRFAPLQAIDELRADARFSADARIREKEAGEAARKVERSLARALSEIPEEDRRILDLRFESGLPIAHIGDKLGLRRKALYARLRRILRALRGKLEAKGIGPEALLSAQRDAP